MRQTRGNDRLRAAMPLVAITGGLVTLSAVASGLQGMPALHPPELPGITLEIPTFRPGLEEEPGFGDQPRPDPVLGAALGWVGAAIGLALLLVVAYLLARYLRQRWQERALARRAGASIDGLAVVRTGLPETEAEQDVRRAVERALDALDAPAESGDAIVAAWIGLEETLQQAGVRRGDSETPAEFVVRVVGRRHEAASDLQTLLRLYENVRFGGVIPTEADRARARSALVGIEEAWR